MNINQLSEALEAIEWLSSQATRASTTMGDSTALMEMGLYLAVARSYMAEYTVNVSRGMEPIDALVTAARGDEKLTASQRDLTRVLMPRPQPGAAPE